MPCQDASFYLFSSLRGRLLFLICLATLPAFLFSFFIADNERTALLVRAERDALHLSHLASREHTHQIQGARTLLSWLGGKLAREGMQSPILADPDFLQALLVGYPQLANIGVLAPDGRVLTSAYPLPDFPNMKDNPAFVAALQSYEVEAGTYIISPIFKQPTLNHAYAVRNAKKRVTFVIFNGLNLEWLSDLAQQVELPDMFSLLITDRAGHVLTYVGPAHPEIPPADKFHISGIAEISQSQHGKLLEIHGTNVYRYFVAAPLGQAADLYVAVGLPYEQVLHQSKVAFYRALAALGILTLFTIIAAFMAAELTVIRAVRSLAHTVQRFGAGEFSARAVPPSGHNELVSLVRTFNAMADVLVARHSEVVESHARLRNLANRLHLTRETEASRISRDLHDEIGQMLTALKIDLARLQSHCPSDQTGKTCAQALGEGIAGISQHIDALIDTVRRISSELRPRVLDELGLVAAVEWQAHEIEARTDIAIHVDAENIPSLAPLFSITMFRIVQEALTNVIRHADASLVEISLTKTATDIVIAIQDNGRGISSVSMESKESLGIIGMQERAILIRGQFSIQGIPGRGTLVRITAPLNSEQGDRPCAS